MRRVLLLAVLTILLAACAGPGASDLPPPAHDPPVAFGPSSGTVLRSSTGVLPASYGSRPELPVALDGTTVWLAESGGLARADSTGASAAVGLPPGRWVDGAPLPVPGAGLVLAASSSVVPGSGTRPPGLAVELLAVPRARADEPVPGVAWTAAAPLPWSDDPRSVRTRVVGVAAAGDGARVAVLTASTSTRRGTVAVDLGSRRVLWVADGVLAGAVLDGRTTQGEPVAGAALPGQPVVLGAAVPPGGGAGYSPSSVVGLDVLTGARRTVSDEGSTALSVRRAGPSTVTVAGRRPTSAKAFLTVYDAGGGVRNQVDLGTASAPPDCRWDEAATAVCSGSNRAFALDAPTGSLLWSLPAGGRVAPAVTTAWHGAVYGTTVNGPVVVDARTGLDRNPAPGAAPVVVNAYLGVGPGTGLLSGVVLTPAIG